MRRRTFEGGGEGSSSRELFHTVGFGWLGLDAVGRLA